MAQDQTSGAAGNRYGRDYAKRVANALGAQMVRKGSNECVLNTARISIHCANVGNNRVGVTYDTLKRVSTVFGAFAVGGGYYLFASGQPVHGKYDPNQEHRPVIRQGWRGHQKSV